MRGMRWWDIPAVHAIETGVFPFDPWGVEQLWAELAQPTRYYIVAEADGVIAGYAGIFLLGPVADVQTIAVDSRCHGRGIGRALLTEVMNHALLEGASEMLLEVRSDNHRAISMYAAGGFERISSRPNYYSSGVDAYVMRLRPLSIQARHD